MAKGIPAGNGHLSGGRGGRIGAAGRPITISSAKNLGGKSTGFSTAKGQPFKAVTDTGPSVGAPAAGSSGLTPGKSKAGKQSGTSVTATVSPKGK